MITFSQRYSSEIKNIARRIRFSSIEDRGMYYRPATLRSRTEAEDNKDNSPKLVSDVLRTRLHSEAKYQICSGFLEPFLSVNTKEKTSYFLHQENLRNLSQRELGYDLNIIVDSRTLSFDKGSYNDANFFDLIELAIIFAKKDKREEMIDRINRIFKECSESYVLYNGLIYIKGESGLKSIVSLLKEGLLRSKLKDALSATDSDYQIAAKISADIIQFLFSSEEGKSHTKKASQELVQKIASKVTKADKSDELAGQLSQLVVVSKNMSNQITDIRHTDKHTIPIDEPNVYKLIFQVNMGIAETVILTLPDEFILDNKLEEMKNEYLGRYNINKNEVWVEKPLDDDNIPF